MKKNIFLAFVAIIISVATSCTDERLTEPDVATTTNTVFYEDITYPLTSQRVFSRADAPSLDTDWENMTSIIIANKEVYLPWNIETSGDMDPYQRIDIKKENGWQLIAHTMNHNPFTSDLPWVLMFYNQRSGEMKTFYYADDLLQHNNAMWYIAFNNPQGWLNGTTEVTTPSKHQYMNANDYKMVTNSKHTVDFSGIQKGWNIFTVPSLTYDPNASKVQSMLVSSIAMTQSTITLESVTKETIKGSIIVNGSSNATTDFKNALANASGDVAKEWVLKQANSNRLKKLNVNHGSNAEDIIPEGTASMVDIGVNLLTSNFFGVLKQPTQQNSPKRQSGQQSGSQQYDVNLTIRSESKTVGQIITEGLTGATPYTIEMGESKTGIKLGTWNLKENPTVYLHPVGVLYNMPQGDRSDENEYAFCATGRYKYDVVINPDLTKHVKKYWVEIHPVYYAAKNTNYISHFPQYPVANCDYGSIGYAENASHLQIPDHTNKIYEDENYSILGNNFIGKSTYWYLWNKYGYNPGSSPVWKYIYAPSNNDIRRGGSFRFTAKNNYLKVTLYIETEFEGKTETTVSTRTYVPKFEWDPTQISNYESYNMESLQIIAAGDPILKKIDKNIINTSIYKVTDNTSSEEVVLLTKER